LPQKPHFALKLGGHVRLWPLYVTWLFVNFEA